MKVEYKDFQNNLEKFTDIGTRITVRVMKDGKHILDIVPGEHEEDERVEALHRFAGAIPNPEKTAKEYKEERLMRH